MNDTETIALFSSCLLVVVGVTIWAGRRAAARRRRWADEYFRRGGLVRSLMRRWHRSPRLTDQRKRPEDD